MKTLFQIKETSASSVRHCCRVLSLIVALTALSNGAWALGFVTIQGDTHYGLPGAAQQMTKNGDTYTFEFSASNACSGCYAWVKFFLDGTSLAKSNTENFVIGEPMICNNSSGSYEQHRIPIAENTTYTCTLVYNSNSNIAITITKGTPGGDGCIKLGSNSYRNGDLFRLWISEGWGSTYSKSNTNYYKLSNESHALHDQVPTSIEGEANLYWAGITYDGDFTLTYDNGAGNTGCVNFTISSSDHKLSSQSCCTADPSVNISSVDAGNGQLTVNWSVTGITPTSQTVQYKSGSGAYQDGPAVAANATSATITGLTNGTEYTIKVTATDGIDSSSAEQTGTPAAPTPGGVLPIQGTSYNNGNQLFIYIEGFGGSSAKYKNTDTYELTVKSGNVVVNQREDTPGTLRLYYTLSSGYPMSGTNVLKLVHQESGDCAIITFDNTTYSSHKGCIEPTETPIVYWEKYPTIGNNTIDMYGYLVERWCSPVTEAGFYWKETNDITADDIAIANPATNHKFPAAANPAKNNDSFSKTTPNLSEIITEPTTIYLVNYVTTAGGGTGISDVVALAYSPCFPISSVTLNSDAVSLPEGYKFTFEATARSAGKTPVYKWYLDAEQAAIEAGTATPIEGATSNTYEFTMPDASDHTLRVKVTGDCDASLIATANIQNCTAPTVSLGEDQSANPWTSVTITATQEGVTTAEWSVEPEAELSGTSTSGATFRAGTTGDYTVKYVGSGTACDSSVKAEATVKVTIIADSEDCTNPNAE